MQDKRRKYQKLNDMFIPSLASATSFVTVTRLIFNLVSNGLVFFIAYFLGKKMFRSVGSSLSLKQSAVFIFLTTIAGALIDILWGRSLGFEYIATRVIVHDYPTFIILIPIVSISIWNFSLAYLYLRLTFKHAAFIGILMGIITAPWSAFL